MTQTMIDEQIKTIQAATRKASTSKESAAKFLREAGIIKRTKSESSGKLTDIRKK